ncbi:MAG: hypothetical protein M3362_13880 [Acidobacteriota bacterium]|nr:hypothetical protein [Acidobacteriota bacterium]
MLLLGYYLGSPITMEMVRIIILESFVCLNVTYLFFRLMEIDIAVAAGFAALFSLADYAYMQIFKDMDVLTQILLVEIVLAVTTIILHFVLRKRASKS